jgi:hypothetical protein
MGASAHQAKILGARFRTVMIHYFYGAAQLEMLSDPIGVIAEHEEHEEHGIGYPLHHVIHCPVIIIEGADTMCRHDHRIGCVITPTDVKAHCIASGDFSRPGKPTDNCFIESFNGSLRDECLNVHWFESMEEARARTEAWRIDYNESRPHQALQEETPAQFAMRAKELERSVSFSTAEN